ncbi:MAG TPA: hypothetical protein VM821_02555 [Abditibacteriaceae bacterium]|jgi:hypothetical protein|nr:hypothetical protein [Abditibacteriaceae bacterium]
MDDFARAFQARKKNLFLDAVAFVISALILRQTGWLLPLAVAGSLLAFKLVMLWVNRKKWSREV